MLNYVIIGNSAAAIGCVEGIRKLDKDTPIVIISDEPHRTYSRPLISYRLGGQTKHDKIFYRGENFYTDNNVSTLLGKRVAKLNASSVTLSSGEEIAFGKLLVATGSKPFVPPMTGLDNVKNKFTFMDLDSSIAIDGLVTNGAKSALIVGAGLIGLKAAEALLLRGVAVTVIDMAAKVMPSVLDDEGSALIKARLEQNGAKFILGTVADKFDEATAYLKNGDKVDFDVLVLAVGVRPNTELVKEAGGEVGLGIKTDKFQKTTLDNVYAAGDCTESFDITAGKDKILALLPNAYLQGEAAGVSMAGGEMPYDKAIPMNAIGFFGLHVISAGDSMRTDGKVYAEQIKDKSGNVTGYKKLVFGENKLVGYILIDEVDRAGIYTSLIREQTSLSDVDVTELEKSPRLMLYGKSYRKEKLGGQV
ncbi:MAG: FAD-dependent oxidoreductase [Oscillospiraceae bacterium]|jgi:NAD(P)H-nitrite reductase large subunit|nr:FAD-dependent oxidoreductase [Oscillospiraceae bacterium]